jgi:hypothetical protein
VDYKTSGSTIWIAAATATTVTSVGLTGLTENTTYDYRVRANCATASGNYVSAQFTTAGTTVACPGAYDVSTNGTAGGASVIPVNTDIYGTISGKGDVDYYAVSLPAGAVTITLTTLPADYQLSLVNTNGSTVLASSTNGGTANETISGSLSVAGTYYVRVYPRNNGAYNASSCYTLNVQSGTVKIGGENVIPGNPVTVLPNPAASKANFSFRSAMKGNAVVSVLNGTGTEVLRKTWLVSAGENVRNLDVNALPNGVYFVRVQVGTSVQMTKLVVAR